MMTTEEINALKPEADKIMSISGKTKGSSLKTDKDFIVRKEGQEGLGRLEEALAFLGYPLSYEDVRGFEWQREAQAVLGIYVAFKLFDWEEEDLFAMGYAAPATSLIVKTIMRFVSVRATFEQAASVWKKHYDFGSMEMRELDETGKRVTFRIVEYPFFKYMDSYFNGFLKKTLELVVGARDVQIESRPCTDDVEQCRMYVGTWV